VLHVSGLTFEQLRIPLALLLIIIVAFIFLPGLGQEADEPLAADATPTPSIVVGEPGGAIIATPEPTPIPTPTPTPAATATPEPPDTFSASVFACAALSGSDCVGGFDRMPRRLRAFTALVTFSDARAGDTISVTLSGPVTINGGPYTLQGGGNGYYYSTFQTRGLPEGDYTLTATRNGAQVATATFRRGG
jgi:hypothetical protein